MSAGFYKRRRGILEHIESGEIDLLESGIHDYLCLKANLLIGSACSIPVGFVHTSAPAIHAHCKRVSERTIQRILEHMEVIGWLKTFRSPNQRGNYLTLICRASVHDLAGNEYRINADATTDWRNPVYEPVGQLSPETVNVVGKLAGYREKREKNKRVVASPLPSDFGISPGMRAFALKESVDAEVEFAAFVDHHRSKGSRFVDWEAAWRTWVRRAVKFSPSIRGGTALLQPDVRVGAFRQKDEPQPTAEEMAELREREAVADREMIEQREEIQRAMKERQRIAQ